jgi:hypothetical protein
VLSPARPGRSLGRSADHSKWLDMAGAVVVIFGQTFDSFDSGR